MATAPVSSPTNLGLQPIHISCLRGDYLALHKTLEDPRTLESRTANQETPLILATLMGHAEVVVILIQHGALVDATDKFRRNALAYTTESVFNGIRRKSFLPAGFPELEGAEYRRVIIAAFLSPVVAPQQKNTGIATGPTCFHKTSTGAEVFRSLGKIRTPFRDPRPKTIGFISSIADSTPQAWAISGWSKYTPVWPSKLIRGSSWTKIVLRRVARVVHYRFKPHTLDQGWKRGQTPEARRGSFFASHTECQLAVWYSFMLLEAMVPMEKPSMSFLASRLGDLSHADLGNARYASIKLDQPPCESCARFLQALTKVTKVSFELVYCRTLALVPEIDKTRSFRLAHETEILPIVDIDEGSDTDGAWDADSGRDTVSENNANLMDHTDSEDDSELVHPEGWRIIDEDETLLGGDEEFEIHAYDPRKKHVPQREEMGGQDDVAHSEGSDTTDNADIELEENHCDEGEDKNYHSCAVRPTDEVQSAQDLQSLDVDHNTSPGTPRTSLTRTSSPLRKAASQDTTIRSATEPNGTPSSPIGNVLSNRKHGQSKTSYKRSRLLVQKYRQATIRSFEHETQQIKKEKSDPTSDRGQSQAKLTTQRAAKRSLRMHLARTTNVQSDAFVANTQYETQSGGNLNSTQHTPATEVRASPSQLQNTIVVSLPSRAQSEAIPNPIAETKTDIIVESRAESLAPPNSTPYSIAVFTPVHTSPVVVPCWRPRSSNQQLTDESDEEWFL